MADNLMPIEEARKIRTERASLISLLESGDLSLMKVLRRPPDILKSVPVWDILISCKGFGSTGAKNTLQGAKVWPMTEMKNLSKNQRERIIENLPPRMKD